MTPENERVSNLPKDLDSSFVLGDRRVGVGSPCFVIGEVAQAHDGSLGTAHNFIDAIADAGADAVKFQTHIAAAESTLREPWRVRFSPQDSSRFDYWKRMEFTEEQWYGLKKHAVERGLVFLSSPFSVEAAELLCRVGVPGWKIASGELSDTLLLEFLYTAGLPLLLSGGMSDFDELDEVASNLSDRQLPFGVMQCTSAYPCPPEKVGLNLLSDLRRKYGCPVGLSDHSGVIFPGLAATVLGANLLEIHLTLSRRMFGPDVPASLTPDEFQTLVEGVRYIERMMAHPVDKRAIAQEMQPLREVFTKSVVARWDLPAGTVLQQKHLAVKKPGTGIPPKRLRELIGRRLNLPLKQDEMILENHLEPAFQ